MISQSSSAISVKLDHDRETIEMAPKALEDGLVVLGNAICKRHRGNSDSCK
jgi:hypothetical protein